MTKAQVTKIFESATEEQLQAILDIHTADIGKAKDAAAGLSAELAEAKNKLASYEATVTELNGKLEAGSAAKEELDKLRKEIAEKTAAEKAAAADKAVTDGIMEALSGKKFTSEYARNGIAAEIKAAIQKPENTGKSYAELFEVIVKDKDGVLANPNPPVPLPSVGDINPQGDIGAYLQNKYGKNAFFKPIS